MAYGFAGVPYEFRGGLWLSTFHSSLRRQLGGLSLTLTLTLPCWTATFKPMTGWTGHVIEKEAKNKHHKTR